jgi:LacI family transcriptional regulator
MHPQRPRLADHVAAELRSAIAAGRWVKWLPNERDLAHEMHVSRSILRDALGKMRAEGLVRPVSNQGHRILRTRGSIAKAPPVYVNLLMPEVIAVLRFHAARWIGDFHAQISNHGWVLRIITSKAAYTNRPSRALRRLVEHNPAACWVLRLSNKFMQQWFESAKVPCVIAGTCYPGISLPFVDRDHRTLCRHAVGRFIAAGHRHIALLIPSAAIAGNEESEHGFREALAAAEPGTQSSIVRLPANPHAVDRTIARLMATTRRPTAIVLIQPENYLSVFSSLLGRGFVVPRDVSLVSCAHDSFLDHLVPRPSGYRLNPGLFSERVLKLVLQTCAGHRGRDAHLLLPEFQPGASTAPPATCEIQSSDNR